MTIHAGNVNRTVTTQDALFTRVSCRGEDRILRENIHNVMRRLFYGLVSRLSGDLC
jgi:hypothetical protein